MKEPRYRLSNIVRNPNKYLRKRINYLRRITLKEPERMFKLICFRSCVTILQGKITSEHWEPTPLEIEADEIISGPWSLEESQHIREITNGKD